MFSQTLEASQEASNPPGGWLSLLLSPTSRPKSSSSPTHLPTTNRRALRLAYSKHIFLPRTSQVPSTMPLLKTHTPLLTLSPPPAFNNSQTPPALWAQLAKGASSMDRFPAFQSFLFSQHFHAVSKAFILLMIIR